MQQRYCKWKTLWWRHKYGTQQDRRSTGQSLVLTTEGLWGLLLYLTWPIRIVLTTCTSGWNRSAVGLVRTLWWCWWATRVIWMTRDKWIIYKHKPLLTTMDSLTLKPVQWLAIMLNNPSITLSTKSTKMAFSSTTTLKETTNPTKPPTTLLSPLTKKNTTTKKIAVDIYSLILISIQYQP